MKTFSCNFSNGVSCTVTADDIPAKSGNHIRRAEWVGKPNKEHLRPYIAWMNSVNQELADEWGVSLMHVYLVSATVGEVWAYDPGKQPKRVV